MVFDTEVILDQWKDGLFNKMDNWVAIYLEKMKFDTFIIRREKNDYFMPT